MRKRNRDIVSAIVHETDEESSENVSQGPWWLNLDADFYRNHERFALDYWDSMRVGAMAASDLVLRTVGATMVGTLAIPVGYHPFKIKEMIKDREFYASLVETRDPARFFLDPPRDVKIRQEPPAWPYFRPYNGRCIDLIFDSPFEPVNPAAKKAYCGRRANMTAYARYWRHGKGPRPTICAFHGFFGDPYWVNEWFFALPWYYGIGADVMLFTLPFHGPRADRLAPFSGYELFSGGFSVLNEAFAQAVFDFRILLNYLEDEMGVTDVGVTGISLGGYTAALLAAVEKRIRFSIPNVPVASIGDLVLEWFPMSVVIRGILAALGLSVKDVRHMLAVHCPLTYKPLLPRDRLMIVGGAGDRLASPKHSRLLWEHWDRCRIHWFPGSHVLHLDGGRYRDEIAKFLRDIHFLNHN